MHINISTEHRSFRLFAEGCREFRIKKRNLYITTAIIAATNIVLFAVVWNSSYEQFWTVRLHWFSTVALIIWSFYSLGYLQRINPIKIGKDGGSRYYLSEVHSSETNETLYLATNIESGVLEMLEREDFEELMKLDSLFHLEPIYTSVGGGENRKGIGWELKTSLEASSGSIPLAVWISNIRSFLKKDDTAVVPVEPEILQAIVTAEIKSLGNNLEALLNKDDRSNLFDSAITADLEGVEALVRAMNDNLNNLYDRGVIGACSGYARISSIDDSGRKFTYNFSVKAGVVMEADYEGLQENREE